MNLLQKTNLLSGVYRLVKSEVHPANGGTFLVIVRGGSETVFQLETPEFLSMVLAEHADKGCDLLVFQADTYIMWADPLGMPESSSEALVSIGASRDDYHILCDVYYKTETGLAFERVEKVHPLPFDREVRLLQGIWK